MISRVINEKDPSQVSLAKYTKLSFACVTRMILSTQGIFEAGLHLFNTKFHTFLSLVVSLFT